jgi:hypothetical protein
MKTKRVLGFKLARPDGFDFYTGKTINYRENVGQIVRPPKPNASLGVCSSGVLHASKNPKDCFVGANIPCSAYRVSGIPVCGDKTKWGFIELKVIREISDLDKLFGWKYSEVINPIYPFKLRQVTQVTNEQIDLLRQWASVRASVWDSVWDSVRDSVWASVRDSVWASVWASVRDSVWASVWDSVWDSVWASVRDSVWGSVRDSVWASVRASVRDYVSSLFPNIKKWKFTKHKAGIYPFQPAVDLWRQGIVPSFDGKLWHLHSGEKATIIWEGKL